jgi:DNA phosphorothioation-associated putative methyltransferase
VAELGKKVHKRRYIGAEQVKSLEEQVGATVTRALELLAPRGTPSFNVVRLDDELDEIALLDYPDLGVKPFPGLLSSWRVHFPTSLVTYRYYGRSLNPPILHRTELLLPHEHERRDACEKLTNQCESLGLFANTKIIGYRQQWLAQIQQTGYELMGFELAPIANVKESDSADYHAEGETGIAAIERHRTALSRASLSAPVQSLLRDGLLRTGKLFFDYGCGRGDDLAALQGNGYDVQGWDPYYRPESKLREAHVVNLGFVINVIEDPIERAHALIGAFDLATEVLAVAAMLATEIHLFNGRTFGDGVVTRRNTFQKYYSQSELQEFIEATLDQDAYPASPGVFYVFKSRSAEQNYLLGKSSDRFRVARLWREPSIAIRSPRPSPPAKIKTAETEEAVEYLNLLWNTALELGRAPGDEEMPNPERARSIFGSHKRALKTCFACHDLDQLASASTNRRNDILVMLAIQFFGRRRRFSQLNTRLRNDIKEFFGSLQQAELAAQKLLFSVQDKSIIFAACNEAAALGLGWLEIGHSLQLHTSLIPQLPAVLRVYIACATTLAGSLDAFDLVKAHIESGKVTLMRFNNFAESPLPELQCRIKVKLREQDLDIFEYNDAHSPTLLYFKSRFINEEFVNYAEQIAFEDALRNLDIFDFGGYGPSKERFYAQLAAVRYQVQGFELSRSTTIPSLDSPCGARLTFRHFVQCSETWESTREENIPTSAATYNAIADLARFVIDPVMDYFGGIRLTYGFSSARLSRAISKGRGGIAPKLDQHACHETSAAGNLICSRGGAAVDFIVDDEDMREVANWILKNTPFDRIYFYGINRPIHVSYAPERSSFCFAISTRNDRRIPKRVDRF